MKNLLILITLSVLLYSCSKQENKNQDIYTLTLTSGFIVDDIYVGTNSDADKYHFTNVDSVSVPIDFLTEDKRIIIQAFKDGSQFGLNYKVYTSNGAEIRNSIEVCDCLFYIEL